MAIYCPKCGKELPDDAQFCMKCGKSLQEPPKSTTQPEHQWEYCEIVYDREDGKPHFSFWGGDYLYPSTYSFWAKAVGTKGVYNAGSSQKWQREYDTSMRYSDPDSGEEQVAGIHNALIAQLISEGWEVLPNKGQAWFSYKFRRQVSVHVKPFGLELSKFVELLDDHILALILIGVVENRIDTETAEETATKYLALKPFKSYKHVVDELRQLSNTNWVFQQVYLHISRGDEEFMKQIELVKKQKGMIANGPNS